jgi:hypothetical protein
MSNEYVLLLLAFILAVLAHIKLNMLQRITHEVYSTLSDRMDKYQQVFIKNNLIQDKRYPSVKQETTIVQTHVLPDTSKIQSDVLQAFYKLDSIQRSVFFKQLMHENLPELHGSNFEAFWKACIDNQGTPQRAFEIQRVLQSFGETSLDTFAKIVGSFPHVPPVVKEESAIKEDPLEPLETASKAEEAIIIQEDVTKQEDTMSVSATKKSRKRKTNDA